MRIQYSGIFSLAIMLGCNGLIGEATDEGGAGGTPAPRCGRSVCGATGELAAGTAFPRLTHRQWENSVRDLLRLADRPDLSDSFEPDTRISFFDNNIRALRVTRRPRKLWRKPRRAIRRFSTACYQTVSRVTPGNAFEP